MKVSELYMLNDGWHANTEIDVYNECDFKGRMPAYSLDLIYGDCSVKCFNETYIILKEEENTNE